MRRLIDALEAERTLSAAELLRLLREHTPDDAQYLTEKSRRLTESIFGDGVYIRGLIEFTNYCRCSCYYCGLRCENTEAARYRLSEDEIMECCETGYELGFRTFVLQGGEDPFFTDEKIESIVSKIRGGYPDCAITLSIGERSRGAYQRFFDAGANRFLLRHETANPEHYAKLHPARQSWQRRIDCLRALKEIGYQTGTGFMVGSPFQTPEMIVEDIQFLERFKPEMIGIGPFVPQHSTPLGTYPRGSSELTVLLIGILRLMHPHALIPSTTALGTIDPTGREKGILAGGNVVMPNLSPRKYRAQYAIYDNKIATGEEAAESRSALERRMNSIGRRLLTARGDFCAETKA